MLTSKIISDDNPPYPRVPSTPLTSCDVLSMIPITNPLLFNDGGGGGSKCRWASELYVPACDEGQDEVEHRGETHERSPRAANPPFIIVHTPHTRASKPTYC